MTYKLTQEEREDLVDWIRQGYTQSSIAKAFGVSQPCVHGHAKRNGLLYTDSPDILIEGDTDGTVHQAHVM